MLNYPKSSIAMANSAPFAKPLVNYDCRGNVSVNAELNHVSLIVYAVPVERVEALIPPAIQIEPTVFEGRESAWVSVESFMDQNGVGLTAFEQTDYRLHVLREGEHCRWLLGSSIGSLSAVGGRNLWPSPWHLGAMEFQVAYEKSTGRYQRYGLQTQSEWVNASWQFCDTGRAIDAKTLNDAGFPASLFANSSTDLFGRRDGCVGARRSLQFSFEFTRAELKQAKCDLLERLGLLRRDELTRPALAALQHRAFRQIFSPTVISESQIAASRPEIHSRSFAYAI